MNNNIDKVTNGLINYAEAEIMEKLPTMGKWIMGTGFALASNRISDTVELLKENTIVKMLGIIDEEGNVDTNALLNAMQTTAEKYGKMTIDVPWIGKMTFSSSDVDRLRSYIV